MSAAFRDLCLRLGVACREGAPLAEFTNLRIGGEARFLAHPAGWEAVPDLLAGLWAAGEAFRILGSGSNLLVEEGPLPFGLVHLRRCGGTARWDGGTVEVDADVPLPALAAEAVRRGLAGLEALAGVPGSVGGAVIMNAGAYGAEMAQVLTHVAVVEKGRGLVWHEAADFHFGYRTTDVASRGVVAGCRMRLAPGDAAALSARFESLKARRLATQPWTEPTAGSVFKNPPQDFAGRLLESLGFRGKRRGGARLSERHANFLVNGGGATFEDAWGLCEEARAAAAGAGVALEYEMEVWRRGE